jgi:hypothetical protein
MRGVPLIFAAAVVLTTAVPTAYSAQRGGGDLDVLGEELSYLGETTGFIRVHATATVELAKVYAEASDQWDEIAWQDQAIGVAGALSVVHQAAQDVTAPAKYRSRHASFMESLRLGDEAANAIRNGIANDDFASFELAGSLMNDSGDAMNEAVGVRRRKDVFPEDLPDPVRAPTEQRVVESPPNGGAPADGSARDGFLSGSGSIVTDPITLPAGVYSVTGSHRGESNFIVSAITQSGDEEFLFNEIGRYSGTLSMDIETSGPVVFTVEADGAWTLEIEDPFGG